MGEWARSAAAWLNEQTSETKTESKTFVEQRALLRSQSDVIWNEIRDGLERECKDLEQLAGRKILDFEIRPQSQAVIRNLRTGAVVAVQFDPDGPLISWTRGARKGWFSFEIKSACKVGLLLGAEATVTTQEAI